MSFWDPWWSGTWFQMTEPISFKLDVLRSIPTSPSRPFWTDFVTNCGRRHAITSWFMYAHPIQGPKKQNPKWHFSSHFLCVYIIFMWLSHLKFDQQVLKQFFFFLLYKSWTDSSPKWVFERAHTVKKISVILQKSDVSRVAINLM